MHHDQVSRGFSAFGVGIVNMIVKSVLIPLLGHFNQMIFSQLFSDLAWISR